MPKHPKRPRDPAQLAKLVVDIAAGTVEDKLREPKLGDDAPMSELGRRGGLKGGAARAAKLSSSQRKEIARKAAKSRWAAVSAKQSDGDV
jgi:hypothetical protein